MAQVVQRRGTPAYLVVVFVILSLIGAALAVLFYVKWDEDARGRLADQEQHAKTKKKLDKLANEDIPALIRKITISNTDEYKEVVNLADVALKRPYASQYADGSLISAIEGLTDLAGKKDERINALGVQIADQGETIKQKDATITKIKSDFDGQTKAIRQKQAGDEAAFQRALKAKDDQLARATADKDATIEEREKEKAILARMNDDLDMEKQGLLTRISILNQTVRDTKGTTDFSIATLLQYDGKVVRALPDQQLIFINLGENDNVKPGLPFAVYDKNKGIPKDGKSKAKLMVVNVGPTTAECRIVDPATEDPIVEGDLVANLVFNTHRVHQIVVEGEFDLYGEGRTDPLGNRRVRKMIEDYGGKLGEQVSVNTDFVVMGEEPESPLKPTDDASPAEWRIFTEKRKKYNGWKQTQLIAMSLQIPVLNTTRFLAFSGYVPKKRLTD